MAEPSTSFERGAASPTYGPHELTREHLARTNENLPVAPVPEPREYREGVRSENTGETR